MIFDVSFEIIESHPYNPASFILAPLVNLLSYTCSLKSLEIIANFACCAVLLRKDAFLWEYTDESVDENERSLILCNEGRDKKALLVDYRGEFSYL
jgi:hypothetical protein